MPPSTSSFPSAGKFAPGCRHSVGGCSRRWHRAVNRVGTGAQVGSVLERQWVRALAAAGCEGASQRYHPEVERKQKWLLGE